VQKIHPSREGGRFEHGVDVLFFYARMSGHWSSHKRKGTDTVESSTFPDQSGSIPDAGTLAVGSLFSGIGGFELGFEATGRFETRWQVECDPYATKVLEKHWPDVQRHDDVCTWPNETTERVDVLIGGFPCQDISYAGKGAGLDGERSGLFYEFMRIVRLVGPKYVVLENVAALFTRGMDQVLGTLASHGYDAEWEVVSAASVGAPHRRDRVFIIGCVADSLSAGTGDQNGTTGRQKRKSANAFKPATLRQGDWETLPEGTDASSADCGTLADSDDKQCKGCEQETLRGKSRISRESRRSGENQRTKWATEPSVGGTINGISRELDEGLTNEEKERAGEILRVVRGIYDEEEIRDAARRLDSVSETQVLLSIMCEFSETENQRWVEMASKEAKERTLRELWKRIESACTPLQSQHKRQLSWKLADALRKLSCNTPSQFPQMWKRGQWEDGTPRVASGIPNRAHRLRCLGNAIVPQVAQVVAERLLEIHDQNN